MKSFISFMNEWGKVVLPLIFLILVASWWRYRKFLRDKNYVIQTLKKNGLANDETRISRGKIKWPNKSVDEFKAKNSLLCELFKNPRIIDFENRNHTVYFKEAKFPDRVPLNLRPSAIEVGRDHDNKAFSLLDFNTLMRVGTGGGKSVLLNNAIHGFYKSERQGNFELLISDPHQSFLRLKELKGVDVFDVSTIEEKERFLEKLKAVKQYQQEIDLSFYETLSEAQKDGKYLDKKSYFIIVDEFSESFSNANSKEEDYQVNQEIIGVLKDLITSGRKFSQRMLIAYQSSLNSQALIHPSLFQAQIYGYVEGEVADAKGLPITHQLLKQSGNFYYTSKRFPAKFFRTAFIEKKDLLDFLKGKTK